MINSSEDISLVTLSGEKTVVETPGLEEMKNMLLLCQLETNIYRFNATFIHEEYDELLITILQIISLRILKVVKWLLTLKYYGMFF